MLCSVEIKTKVSFFVKRRLPSGPIIKESRLSMASATIANKKARGPVQRLTRESTLFRFVGGQHKDLKCFYCLIGFWYPIPSSCFGVAREFPCHTSGVTKLPTRPLNQAPASYLLEACKSWHSVNQVFQNALLARLVQVSASGFLQNPWEHESFQILVSATILNLQHEVHRKKVRHSLASDSVGMHCLVFGFLKT